MEIGKVDVDTFWKGEKAVRAVVRDSEKEYKVVLQVKGSQVYDYSCSCPEWKAGRGMCRHASALWESCRADPGRTELKHVSTSQEVRAMVREYTNRQVARLAVEEEREDIEIIPKIVAGWRDIQLEFSLRASRRQFRLTDLAAFSRAMEEGAKVTYGKDASFYHVAAAFHPESRSLASFITKTVGTYAESSRQLHKGGSSGPPALKSFILTRYLADAFFNLMIGRSVEFAGADGRSRRLEVTDVFPGLRVKVEQAGQDGVAFSVDQGIYSFSGESCLYLVGADHIYCCDTDCAQSLGVFLEQMAGGMEGGKRILVNDRDMPLFYERVLRSIDQYTVWEVSDGLDLERYRPEPLQASFYFDSRDGQDIRLKPVLSYGDVSFHPMEDDGLTRSLCRDVPAEYRVGQLITRYFHYRDPDSGDLVMRDDDDGIYRFLTEGMPQFLDAGKVHLSEAVRRMRVLPPPEVSLGVSMTDGWLELTVDTGGLTGQDLVKLLSAYQTKKRYYRMKKGEFLTLDSQSFQVLSGLVQQLGITRQELARKAIRLPKYRAYYLDQVMKDSGEVRLYRDRLFKQLVRQMKGVEDGEYELPDPLRPVLRGYQKTGFRWMKTLDAQGFCGVLADDMGLGKTIQVIALLLDEAVRDPVQVSLVICPASLVYNWEHEIRRFAPDLKVMSVTGNSDQRREKISYLREVQVAITSYDLLRRDIDLYREVSFRYEVVDEAQYIKNAATQSARAVKAIHARTRFALTGTPMENRMGELWSVFDFLMPGFLFSYQKFRRRFELPVNQGQDKEALQTLRRLIGPFILRRMKEDVLKDLPPKLEQIVYARLEGEQSGLYTAHAWKLKQQLEQGDGEGGKLEILAQLTRLRQICCDPALCLERYRGGSAKLETCMQIIASGMSAGHKMLLFSQFASMLDRIGQRLKKEGIPFYQLTGGTSKEDRLNQVSAFQRDGTPIFLISLKAGGTGLNLTAADIVIHYDPWWNAAVENQATDRTHRIGQTRQVTVYKLIARDTIEENIQKLQERKRHLVDQVMGKGAASSGMEDAFPSLGSLSREELLALLEGDIESSLFRQE